MADNQLRGLIVSKFHSVMNFARVIKWSSRKAYDIVNGKQEPTGTDIDQMCNVLGIEIPENMRILFFAK